jgi:hypothetical protein
MEFTRLHADRLYRLADYLYVLETKKFNFTSWVNGFFEEDKLECGTTACALGHAATMPEFRALGLRLFRYPDTKERGYVGLASLELTVPMLGPECAMGWTEACGATKEIFGLTMEETSFLFVPEQSGLDEVKVADHIISFLIDKEYPR